MLNTQKMASVLFTAGVVFDNLRSSRLSTLSFLSSGDTSGIASRADLELLKDLRDASHIVIQAIDEDSPLSTEIIQNINAAMTRSASLNPGVFRKSEENIGVATPYGRHEPQEIDENGLNEIIGSARALLPVERAAATLFVLLAKAQPFGDGNKRTALLAANVLLRGEALLTAPFSENNPEIGSTFQDLLARAYIYDEIEPCVDYLVAHGIETLAN